MTKRRSRGDGGLHWDESRQRWIASVTVGYTPAGKRIVKKASGKTKTAAKDKLKQIIRDYEDGLVVSGTGYTVADAVQNWLDFGLSGRDAATVEKCKILANKHVISGLGARKLVDLTADDVDRWLADKSKDLSTRTLRELRSILVRSISRAQARDKVKRNVVLLCEIPKGKEGRPSKSLTLAQAEAVLKASEGTALHAYVVLSLLLGARTEELRALTWSHVNLDGTPPSIMVWRSVREGGDTKTKKSRRTLAMPRRCVDALKLHHERQEVAKKAAGNRWQDNDLVFASKVGTELDAHNVRRSFRAVLKKAGLDPKDWTPREMRHSFVSLLSDSGMPIEAISRLVGHRNTSVTETVYRKQLRPVLLEGAEAMDRILPPREIS
ncbi:site-specific integrase [Nonomuraea fuscirosea]|uniref:site-specific integrase n=1 Tax=Nonomuraea fuscirosea TaxID=1291556 RepID=UPI0034415B35